MTVIFSPRAGLAEADGREVAVALIGEDDVVRQRPLHTRRDCGRTSMRRLDHVTGKVVIGQHGTADRRNADRPALDAERVDRLGDEPMDDAMRAAGAVVEYGIGQRLRFFKYNSHQSFPPSFALRIASSTSSGDGIMPPTRKQRSTGFLHATASCTSSRIWPMLSSTQTNRFT